MEVLCLLGTALSYVLGHPQRLSAFRELLAGQSVFEGVVVRLLTDGRDGLGFIHYFLEVFFVLNFRGIVLVRSEVEVLRSILSRALQEIRLRSPLCP